MFRILLAFLLLTSSAQAQQWSSWGSSAQTLGQSQAALIGYNIYNSILQPLNNYLGSQCNEYLQYTSSSTITVVAGTCVDSNSQGTIRLIMYDTSNTTLTSANLDTGSITASTTYYVYSTAASTTTTTSTYYISASNIAPSGQTYYFKIGQFSTDSNSQFTGIINNTWQTGYVQLGVAKSSGVIYQALTDGDVEVSCSGSGNAACYGYTNSSSNASSQIFEVGGGNGSPTLDTAFTMIIRKGDYWQVTTSGSASASVIFVPTGK